jgi:hypothetical protein
VRQVRKQAWKNLNWKGCFYSKAILAMQSSEMVVAAVDFGRYSDHLGKRVNLASNAHTKPLLSGLLGKLPI